MSVLCPALLHAQPPPSSFCASFRGAGPRPASPPELVPASSVELAPASARLLEENLEAINAIGFEIEPFGTNTFRVRAPNGHSYDQSGKYTITVTITDVGGSTLTVSATATITEPPPPPGPM